jgi:hypothetical protein
MAIHINNSPIQNHKRLPVGPMVSSGTGHQCNPPEDLWDPAMTQQKEHMVENFRGGRGGK